MGKKLLIIDDNEQDRKIMERYMAGIGIEEVFHASSGEEGIKAVEDQKPDITILDTNLPQMDGFEVCKAIKEIEGTETKVIMLTGFVDAVDAGKARRMGADDYCVKTSDGKTLIDAIKKFV